MKSMLTVLMMIVCCLSLNAAAQQQNYTEESPMSGVFSAPCTTEPVAVSGSLIANIHLMFNGSIGLVQFHVKEGDNTVGIGMVSNAVYKVRIDEKAQFQFDRNTLTDQGIRQKFVLSGSGPDNDLIVRYVLRATFDAETQQFRTRMENSTVECK